MSYVVTENCIKCKHTDCVEVCPVDCFHEGENMLVIDPDECIDCALCAPECPADAIYADDDILPEQLEFRAINARYARLWPSITQWHPAASDAADWNCAPNKYRDHFSPDPA